MYARVSTLALPVFVTPDAGVTASLWGCLPHTPTKGCLCEHPLGTRAKTFHKSFIKTTPSAYRIFLPSHDCGQRVFPPPYGGKTQSLSSRLRVAVSFSLPNGCPQGRANKPMIFFATEGRRKKRITVNYDVR